VAPFKPLRPQQAQPRVVLKGCGVPGRRRAKQCGEMTDTQ
jgi:hypothetical protein